MGADPNYLESRALADIKAYLDCLISSTDIKDNKRASLLSYWLSDYIRLLKKEKKFEPQKLMRYKRGEIVKAHLGYNIGSEEGGLHYAIILEKKNNLSSPVLTIVPLTSIKANTNVANLPSDNLLLGNEIYTLLSQKLKTYLKEIDEQREYIISEVTKISKKIDSINMNDSDGPETIREMREKIKSLEIAAEHLKNKKGQSEKVNGELSRMKIGSIALVGQITTISKIRIYNPLSTKDSLGRVRISDETLDKLDKKLVELFTNIPIENATSS